MRVLCLLKAKGLAQLKAIHTLQHTKYIRDIPWTSQQGLAMLDRWVPAAADMGCPKRQACPYAGLCCLPDVSCCPSIRVPGLLGWVQVPNDLGTTTWKELLPRKERLPGRYLKPKSEYYQLIHAISSSINVGLRSIPDDVRKNPTCRYVRDWEFEQTLSKPGCIEQKMSRPLSNAFCELQ